MQCLDSYKADLEIAKTEISYKATLLMTKDTIIGNLNQALKEQVKITKFSIDEILTKLNLHESYLMKKLRRMEVKVHGFEHVFTSIIKYSKGTQYVKEIAH